MSKKLAYLYARVSKESQVIEGDGLRRQEENAINFLKMHPEYTLADTILDKGVSSFDGSNIAEKAGLGSFLTACKQGSIPEGSMLICESPDRLTRLGIKKGQQLFNLIQEHKIDVGLVRFGSVIKHDDTNDITGGLLVAVGLYLAHLESQQKSERIKHTFNIRREASRVEGGKKRTSVCPAWLKLNEDRTEFVAIPEKVELLKMLFEMKLKQDKGPDAIARQLNKEGVVSLTGNKWSRTTIRKYLKDPKCIGTFQPQTVTKVDGKKIYTDEGSPIEDYYPCVVDKVTYLATQQTFTTTPHGRKGRFTNLFKGIIACGKCGGSLEITTTQPKGGVKRLYLKCSAKVRGLGCDAKQVPYQPIEDTLVEIFQTFDYSKLIKGNESNVLQEQIEQLQIEQKAIETQIDIEVDNASQGNPAIRQRFVDRANKLSEESRVLQEEVATKQTELLSITNRSKTVDLQIDDYDSRQRFNSFLRQHVDVIKPYKTKIMFDFKNRGYSSVVGYYDKPLSIVDSFIYQDDI